MYYLKINNHFVVYLTVGLHFRLWGFIIHSLVTFQVDFSGSVHSVIAFEVIFIGSLTLSTFEVFSNGSAHAVNTFEVVSGSSVHTESIFDTVFQWFCSYCISVVFSGSSHFAGTCTQVMFPLFIWSTLPFWTLQLLFSDVVCIVCFF